LLPSLVRQAQGRQWLQALVNGGSYVVPVGPTCAAGAATHVRPPAIKGSHAVTMLNRGHRTHKVIDVPEICP